MTKDDLKKYSQKDIKNICLKFNLRLDDYSSKDEVIDEIFEILNMEDIEVSKSNNSIMQNKAINFRLANFCNFDFIPLDDKSSYALFNTLFKIILKDPQWIFVLWKVGLKDLKVYKLENSEYDINLRVKYGKAVKDLEKAEESDNFFDIRVDMNDKNRYVNLPKQGMFYCAELLCKKNNSNFTILLGTSNIIYNPKITIHKNDFVDVNSIIKLNCIENYIEEEKNDNSTSFRLISDSNFMEE